MSDTQITERLTDISRAARLIAQGRLVAFPTETVFGLGADATNESAVEKIFLAKGRPQDNPLIVHLHDMSDWELAAANLPEQARELLKLFSPGPITAVVPKAPHLSSLVTAGMDTVGIRIPGCPIAREFLRLAERPVAAPSANRSGRPSCTEWKCVLEDLDGRIDAVLCRNSAEYGLESTVVDCTGPQLRILRAGAITVEQLTEHFPDVILSPAMQDGAQTTGNAHSAPEDDRVLENSPGLRHAHYQPNARVTVFEAIDALEVDESLPWAICGLRQHSSIANRVATTAVPVYAQFFESLRAYAANYFSFLREADRRGAQQIYVQLAPSTGLGLALRDRQLRSAGQR